MVKTMHLSNVMILLVGMKKFVFRWLPRLFSFSTPDNVVDDVDVDDVDVDVDVEDTNASITSSATLSPLRIAPSM